jgi:DNA-binding transcriptional regulator GbsR (MarR family)
MTDPFARFAERVADAFVALGFPRMPANVIMTLMMSEEGRLTSAELTERLGVSAAAISGAVRYLSTVGMVEASTVPGTRRHVYRLPDRQWYTASIVRPSVYSALADLVEREAAMLPPSPAADRGAEMASFLGFLRDRMPGLLAEWQEQQRGE